MPRRYADYPEAFAYWNWWSSIGAYITALGSLVFLVGMLYAYFVARKKAPGNPWGAGATTLESGCCERCRRHRRRRTARTGCLRTSRGPRGRWRRRTRGRRRSGRAQVSRRTAAIGRAPVGRRSCRWLRSDRRYSGRACSPPAFGLATDAWRAARGRASAKRSSRRRGQHWKVCRIDPGTADNRHFRRPRREAELSQVVLVLE